MRLTTEQVEYMKTVLGIDGVLLPSQIPGSLTDDSVAGASAPNDAQDTRPAGPWRQSSPQASPRFALLVSSRSHEFPLERDAADLVKKMVQAMKIVESEILTLEWTNTDTHGSPTEVRDLVGQQPYALVLGAETARSLTNEQHRLGSWVDWRGTRLMVTHSPEELLLYPDRKKAAWSHMQNFLREL